MTSADIVVVGGGLAGVEPIRSSEEDVSGDGLLDLTLKFSTSDMFGSGAFDLFSEMGRLTGTTFGGLDIIGTGEMGICNTTPSSAYSR